MTSDGEGAPLKGGARAERERREAAALRENLKRRKAQARARQETPVEVPVEAPAEAPIETGDAQPAGPSDGLEKDSPKGPGTEGKP